MACLLKKKRGKKKHKKAAKLTFKELSFVCVSEPLTDNNQLRVLKVCL